MHGRAARVRLSIFKGGSPMSENQETLGLLKELLALTRTQTRLMESPGLDGMDENELSVVTATAKAMRDNKESGA